MVTAVPNFASIQARLFRSRWYHLEVPRHLYHFTPAALRALLAREQFDVQGASFSSGEHNWAGFLGSIVPLAAPQDHIVARLWRRAAGRPLARAAASLEAAIGRGGIVTLVSQRRG